MLFIFIAIMRPCDLLPKEDWHRLWPRTMAKKSHHCNFVILVSGRKVLPGLLLV